MKPKYIFQSFFIEKILLYKILFFSILLFFVLATSHQSKAQKTWDGGAGTNNWGDANNWNFNTVPTAAEPVVINNATNVTINVNVPAVCSSITLEGNPRNRTISINAGQSLTVSGAFTFGATTADNRSQTLAVNDGVFTCDSVVMANSTNNRNRTNRITISTGTATVNGNITMNGAANENYITFTNNGTLNVTGDIGTGGTITANSGTINISGAFSPITYNSNTGTVNYNRAGNQNIGNYTYYNLTTSGSGTKTLTNATAVNQNLTMNGGVISLGNNNLTVAGDIQTASSFSNTNMIACDGTGNLIKTGTAVTNFNQIYPVGTGTYYTPFEINNLNATILGTGQIIIKPIAALHPTFIAGEAIVKYWTVQLIGISNAIADLKLTYKSPEEAGGCDEAFLAPNFYNGSTWADPTGTFTTGSNPATCTATSLANGAWTLVDYSPMQYVSCTVTQNSQPISPGINNAHIIGIEIVTAKKSNPLEVTSFTLNTAGTNGTTSPLTDIKNARIYYTSTINSFSTVNQFGADVAVVNGVFTIIGSQELAKGTNYFWLTYDIKPTATYGNWIDARCNSIEIETITRIPTTINPAGGREIYTVCDINPYYLYFHGSTAANTHDVVHIPDDDNTLDLTDRGTIEAWVYIYSYTNYGGIVHKGDRIAGGIFPDETYTMQLWDNGTLWFGVIETATVYEFIETPPNSITADSWRHVAATWSPSGMRLYIDGKLQTSNTKVAVARVTTGGLNIGSQGFHPTDNTGNLYPINGIIDEVRIWNIELTEEDIESRMFKNITSTDPYWDNLVGYWKFDEGAGNTTADNSQYNNHGALYEHVTLANPIFPTAGATGPEWLVQVNYVTWKGDKSTDWFDAENWCPKIVPTTTKISTIGTHDFYVRTVVIDTASSGNHPIIDGSNASCYDLYMMPKTTLTTENGRTLTLNAHTNTGLSITGSAILNSDMDGTASFIDHNATQQFFFAGTCTIERWMSGCECLYNYHYLASPISSAPLSIFKDKIYRYNEGHGSYFMNYGWQAASGNMNVGQGYNAKVLNDTTINFVTSPANTPIRMNSGDYTVNLAYTSTTATAMYEGWNLVGNPYPSTLDWENASLGKVNMDNTIYFWNGASYSYYIGTGGSDPSTTELWWNYINDGTRFIPPMQGFFVKANAPGASLTFRNAARTHNHGNYNGGFWKTTTIPDIFLKLKVEGNQRSDETVVHFAENGETEFTDANDAYKFIVETDEVALNLYTKTEEGNILAINTLPTITEQVSVPLLFMCNTSGTYKISISASFLGDSLNVFLEDKKLQKMIDLKKDSLYIFQHSAYWAVERFVLHFSPIKTVLPPQPEEVTDENMMIYAFENSVFVDFSNNETSGSIAIYNLLGQIVYNDIVAPKTLNIFQPKLTTGKYICKIITPQKNITKAIFIQK